MYDLPNVCRYYNGSLVDLVFSVPHGFNTFMDYVTMNKNCIDEIIENSMHMSNRIWRFTLRGQWRMGDGRTKTVTTFPFQYTGDYNEIYNAALSLDETMTRGICDMLLIQLNETYTPHPALSDSIHHPY